MVIHLLSKDMLFSLTYQKEEEKKKSLIILQSAFFCDHDRDDDHHHHQGILTNNKTILFKKEHTWIKLNSLQFKALFTEGMEVTASKESNPRLIIPKEIYISIRHTSSSFQEFSTFAWTWWKSRMEGLYSIEY